VQQAGPIDTLAPYVRGVLAEQIETLRASRDLDPIKKARAIARLASEELRLRALHSRRVARSATQLRPWSLPQGDVRKRQPEFERRKRRLLKRSEEALAETFVGEPGGSPGGGAAGSWRIIKEGKTAQQFLIKPRCSGRDRTEVPAEPEASDRRPPAVRALLTTSS
jgi:hypothetical protein